MADLKKLLAGAGRSWKAAVKKNKENPGGGGFEFDDGVYEATLVDAAVGTSNSDRLQTVFSWRFNDEPYEGKIKKDFQGMASEDNMYYLGALIERLGFEMPEDITDLPEVLKAIVKEGIVAKIQLRTKGDSDFQNVYVKKVISGDADDDATEDEDAEAEDADETEETDAEETGDDEADADEEADDEADTDADADQDADAEEEAEEEAEADEDEDEGVDLEAGTKVIAETAKGPKPGTVVEILEDEGKVRVKLDEDGKIVRVSVDKLSLPDQEEEVPEEPKSKKGKKAAPAPPPPAAKKKVAAAPEKKVAAPAKKVAAAPAKKVVKKGKK